MCIPSTCTAKQMMLAVGDSGGTLHILEIPWNLSHPAHNEVNIYHFILYIERDQCYCIVVGASRFPSWRISSTVRLRGWSSLLQEWRNVHWKRKSVILWK